MSNRIRYLLLADGSSDRALLHIVTWLLHDLLSDTESTVESFFSYPQLLGKVPSNENPLKWRIEQSLNQHFDIDILFIHRDAERELSEKRFDEIETALTEIAEHPPHICIVPVRMTEAWLLIDEESLRYAASNPNGRVKLDFPHIKKIESLPDPKKVLHDLLRQASELRGRRLKSFNANVQQSIYRLAELIEDYSTLRQLPAFQKFENDLTELLDSE